MKKHKWSCLLLLLTLAEQPTVLAQEQVPVTVGEAPLRLRESVVVLNEKQGPMLTPLRCDSSGNIYFRPYGRVGAPVYPVVRVDADGHNVVVFNANTVPDFERAYTNDFATSLRGDVYILAGKQEGVFILRFDSSAKYQGDTKLDSKFEPIRIAPFSSGDLLVTGMKQVKDENDAVTQAPFAGVFGRDGKLIAELQLPDDYQPEKKPTATEKGSAQADAQEEEDPNAIFWVSQAEPGPDGNVYLMRPTPAPIIFVVSPDGTVARRLTVSAPAKGYRPISMKVGYGRVIVQFEESEPSGDFAKQIFSVVDTESGATLARYTSVPQLGVAFACYTPNGLSFLGSKDGLLAIHKTQPTNP